MSQVQAIRSDYVHIRKLAADVLKADAPDAAHRGELGTVTRALSLAGVATGAVAKHVKSMAVAMLHIDDGATVAKQLSVLLVAWRRAVQAEIDSNYGNDKAGAKQEKNRVIEAAGYAIRVLQKQCGVRLAWNEAAAEYDVTTVEAKPKDKPITAAGATAPTNGTVEVNEKVAGAARAEKSELATFTPAELLAALAKHYPSRAAMMQAVKNMDRGHWPAVVGSEGERAKMDKAVLAPAPQPATASEAKKQGRKVVPKNASKKRVIAAVGPELVAALNNKFNGSPAAVSA